MEKKYGITFGIIVMVLVGAIYGLVTWLNPDRITPKSWSIDFVADRNMSYKKFSLLKGKTDYTELIVGSSTSEVLVPEMLEKLYGVKSYLGGTGGSKTPYKWAQIRCAIKNNPNLKRIIYVTDLFEFLNTDLETKIYYQPEIMVEIGSHFEKVLNRPNWVARIQDYISESAVQSAFKTLSDYKKFKAGNYTSQFRSDGSTAKSMVVVNQKEAIEPRVLRIAKGYESQYKNIERLDPLTVEFFKEILYAAKQNKVEITLVIPPWHPLFYRHFEADFTKHNDIYNKWVSFIKSLESPTVQVIDFSYLKSIEKGIGDTNEYWHDGVHFSHKSAEIILNEIYKDKK